MKFALTIISIVISMGKIQKYGSGCEVLTPLSPKRFFLSLIFHTGKEGGGLEGTRPLYMMVGLFC